MAFFEDYKKSIVKLSNKQVIYIALEFYFCQCLGRLMPKEDTQCLIIILSCNNKQWKDQ